VEAAAPSSQVLRAHAKLTLSLRVVGVRADGYHLIDAEMVSLDLSDSITVSAGEGGITASGPFATGVPLDETNLVARALALHRGSAAAGRGQALPETHVAISKQIPHGGGLGGGSTDAAAVLRWAGWGTTTHELSQAAAIGADIAFCMVGGRARVSGIGEIVESLPHLERTVTLVVPPIRVSTPAVYRAWDDLGGPTSSGQNDLESAALSVEPRLTEWRELIAARVGMAPTLAGSGATWFVEGEHQDALGDLVDEGALVVVSRTVRRAVAAPRIASPSG